MIVDHQASPPPLNDQGIIDLVQVSYTGIPKELMPNLFLLIIARQGSILPLFVDASFQDRYDTTAESEAQEVDCLKAGEDRREIVALERK